MATIITVVSGRVIPPENSETTTSPTFSSDSNPLQSLTDKFELLKNWGCEAAIALFVIAACEIIKIFCKEVQHRHLSATCMVTSTCSFAYLRDREDTTVGLLAGVPFAGAVFTWNTFSLGVGKHNFDTPYIVVGMIFGMIILWGAFTLIQPLIGPVKIDVFILPSIICSFSILEMIVKV
ncbi:hypothetical protein EAF00_006313 [Botryotinia globosa]|nr:hypothetical protein EAF00_006313 [Botryotinia globosa]